MMPAAKGSVTGFWMVPTLPGVLGNPAVVANGSTGVQYGFEDVSRLVPGWPVCSRVIAVTGQNVGRTATQRARAAAVGCGGTGWVKEKVTLCDCAEVARNVSV